MTKTRRTSITDIAERSGVSISTVSRVLNGHESVGEDLRERVLQAARELNYVKDYNASMMRKSKTGIVGLIVPDISDLFFSILTEAFLIEADRHNLKVILFSYHGNPSEELDCLRKAFLVGMDGIVYVPSSRDEEASVRSIIPEDFPLVILFRRQVLPNVPHIYQDNVEGGRLATNYLLRMGHRKISFFASFWQQVTREEILEYRNSQKKGIFTTMDRLEGYEQALAAAGVEFDPALIVPTGYNYSSNYASAKRFLSEMSEFDGVITCNDSGAAGVMAALQEVHVRIPEDVSIVGYDDSQYALVTRPQLTSIKQQPAALGKESLTMLWQRMQGLEVADRVIGVDLVIRGSVVMKHET